MIVTGSVIELAGPPGAGKTTVAPIVCEVLRERGLVPRTPVEVARDLARRGPLGLVGMVLPRRLRDRGLWSVYLVESTVAGWWNVLRRPGLRALVRAQSSRPLEALTSERRVVRYFVRHLGTESLFRRRAREGEVLVSDEGAVHRAIQLFASPVEEAVPAQIASYLAEVPTATLTVLVVADTETCQQRVRDRGVWSRFAALEPEEVDRFVRNAAGAVMEAGAIARRMGLATTTIDNGRTPGHPDVGRALSAFLADSPPDFRPRWMPPRPGTVQHRLRRRFQGRALPAEAVAAVVEQAGLRLDGSIRLLAGGRRSAIVSVRTNEGSVVVKRYQEHWPEDSVRHEHEVLGHLASVSFPAVRLVPGVDGGTVISHGTSRYAIFRHIEGRSYTGRYLPADMLSRMVADLGYLLATLHDALSDFRPEHRHHLGFDPETGVPYRGLEWYLDRLAGLGAADRTKIGADGRWLADRGSELASRLAAVNTRLAGVDLSTSVIHGDFGAHNVLYSADGPVLHDFELARTDWRLTDVAMVMGRIRADHVRRTFLEAYRRKADLGSEWDALNAVVEWNSLTGAVYAWESYVARDDPARLRVARARAERALALGSERA